jgi:hypothetical protein
MTLSVQETGLSRQFLCRSFSHAASKNLPLQNPASPAAQSALAGEGPARFWRHDTQGRMIEMFRAGGVQKAAGFTFALHPVLGGFIADRAKRGHRAYMTSVANLQICDLLGLAQHEGEEEGGLEEDDLDGDGAVGGGVVA